MLIDIGATKCCNVFLTARIGIYRSLREQILCEKISPPPVRRDSSPIAAVPIVETDPQKFSDTTRNWLMRLQRLEGDYFVEGSESAVGAEWAQIRAQRERQAFFESMWAGYRTGTLVIRKTFTAWQCCSALPRLQSVIVRKRVLECLQQVLDHTSNRISMFRSAEVLHAWAQFVRHVRLTSQLLEQKIATSESFHREVSKVKPFT